MDGVYHFEEADQVTNYRSNAIFEPYQYSDTDSDCSDIETLEYNASIDWKNEIKYDYNMMCKKTMLLATCGKTGIKMAGKCV